MATKRKLSNSSEENVELMKKVKVSVPDEPLTIHINKVTSLTERSAFAVALFLWGKKHPKNLALLKRDLKSDADREDEVDHPCWNPFNEKESNLMHEMLQPLQDLPLPVPPAIFDLIEKQLKIVIKTIRTWIRYHEKMVFLSVSEAVAYSSKIIWKSDGVIDYIGTATNMLSSTCDISSVERYRIMSTFCMQEEIEKLKTLRYTEKTYSINYRPLVVYWNHKIENTNHEISDYQNEPTESKMITFVDNIHAVRYFWQFLCKDERVPKAVSIISHSGVKFQDFILNELNSHELNHLLTDIGPEIIRNYAQHASCFEKAYTVWMYARDYFTCEQYLRLILYLKELESDFLIDIWETTPYCMKQYVLVENMRFLETLTMHPNSATVVYNVSLLLLVLPDMNFNQRKYLLEKPMPWAKMFGLTYHLKKPQLFERVLKLCYLTEAERKNKRSLLINVDDIEEHALELIITAKWKALDEFLSLHELPYPASEFKENIFTSNSTRAIRLLREQKFDLLNEIIDHVLPCAKSAAEFRIKFLTSSSTIKLFFIDLMLRNRPDEVEKCVAKLLSEEAHVKLLKKTLIQFFTTENLSLFYEGDPSILKTLLLSHQNVKEAADEIKRLINLEAVFTYILKRILSNPTPKGYTLFGENKTYDFHKLDNFLSWYFDDKLDKVKEFKLKKITAFAELEVVIKYFERDRDIYMKPLLKWFFDDDNSLIKNFHSVIEYLHSSANRLYS